MSKNLVKWESVIIGLSICVLNMKKVWEALLSMTKLTRQLVVLAEPINKKTCNN